MVLSSVYYPLSVLMSLTLYKRFKLYRMENSPIVTTIYRDGVFYMLCMTRESYIFLSGTQPRLV
jgi:hypothetical protein